MDLTPRQTALLRCLRSAIEGQPNLPVLYCTEWLGYLPFGFYHWLLVDGQDISWKLPLDWSWSDLEALETVGFLVKVDEWKNPEDECETKVTFLVGALVAAK
jgi:hypothetical protein